MPSAYDRNDFAPPHAVGSWRAFGWALLVHVLLMAALTWGVSWKSSDQSLAFDAELWASTVQEAAPRAAQPVTPPAPVEPPTPTPTPPPTPAPTPPPAPEPQIKPIESQVDIALEEEKKRKRLKQQQEAEVAQEAKAQKELKDKKEKAELLAKKEDEKKKEKAQEKAALEKQETAAAQKKLAAQQQAKEQQAAAAAATEQKRKENIQRMRALAGEAGGASAAGGRGQADKSSGPSAGYGAKIRAKVLPNVVFTDEVAGNPRAEVEVTTTADGTILGQRLLKSSGNPAWDDAVLKAIVRTGSLPRDVDGRVPSPMILEFRPKG